MSDLRLAAEVSADFPRTVFVHQGTVEEGEAFFERFHPAAVAIADPERKLFDAFAIQRGGLGRILGPHVLARGVGALLRGHGVGKPVGDVKRMPGLVLLDQGAVIWAQAYRHVGDRPDADGVLEVARGLVKRRGREDAA